MSDALWAAIIGAVATIGAASIAGYVSYRQGRSKGRGESPNWTGIPPEIVLNLRKANDEIAKLFSNVIDGINRGLAIKSPLFQREIFSNLQKFSYVVSDWEKGQLFVDPNNSPAFLVSIYSSAEESIFSTSVKDFFFHWGENLGDQIIQANSQTQADVTRVFIFNNRSEVTSADFEEMHRQAASDIRVKAYFDEEYTKFNFPPNIGKDFTIIDGGTAIGVTETFGRGQAAARWHFEDKNKAQIFLQTQNSLLEGSESFTKFREWWDERNQQSSNT